MLGPRDLKLSLATVAIVSVLFLVEVYTSLSGHSLIIRFSMCHVLFLLVLETSVLAWQFRYAKKITSRFDDSFFQVWRFCSLVALNGLCVVNLVHAIQMLTYRHDEGVHQEKVLLGVSIADLIVKLPLMIRDLKLLRLKSNFNIGCTCAFYVNVCVFNIVIATMQYTHVSDELVLWLDPIFTILATLITAGSVFPQVKKLALILLLAVPRTFHMPHLEAAFQKQFPHVAYHDLRIWREADVSGIVSTVHITAPHSCIALHGLVSHIAQFFKTNGVHRVTIQYEYSERHSGSESPKEGALLESVLDFDTIKSARANQRCNLKCCSESDSRKH